MARWSRLPAEPLRWTAATQRSRCTLARRCSCCRRVLRCGEPVAQLAQAPRTAVACVITVVVLVERAVLAVRVLTVTLVAGGGGVVGARVQTT